MIRLRSAKGVFCQIFDASREFSTAVFNFVGVKIFHAPDLFICRRIIGNYFVLFYRKFQNCAHIFAPYIID